MLKMNDHEVKPVNSSKECLWRITDDQNQCFWPRNLVGEEEAERIWTWVKLVSKLQERYQPCFPSVL